LKRFLCVLFSWFCWQASLFADNSPGFSGLDQGGAQPFAGQAQSTLPDKVIWDQPYPGKGLFSRAAKSKLEAWSQTVTPGKGLSLQDFINHSDQGEVKILLKSLKSMVLTKKPPEEDKFFRTRMRYFEFDKNLLHTRGNLKEDSLDFSRVTLDQLRDARTSGWGDRQSDEDDVYLTRDFFFRIQKAIEDRGGRNVEMLLRVKSKIHSLVARALHAYSRQSSGSDAREILRKWNTLKTVKSSQILTSFPWKSVADNDPGVGRFRSALEWGNSILTYLVLSYTRLYSVELVFWFSQNRALQNELDTLASLEDRVDLVNVERGLPGSSGKLWVHEMVQESRGVPAFRGLAKSVFSRYQEFVLKPRSFRPNLDFLLKRVRAVLASQKVQAAIKAQGLEKVDQSIESYLEDGSLTETFQSLAKIQAVTGASLAKSDKEAFERDSGISFDEFAATGGEKGQLEALVRKSISPIDDPRLAREKVQTIQKASQKLLSSGALDNAVESARGQKVSNSLTDSEKGRKYFESKNGNLVLRAEVLEKVLKGGDTSSVDIAYKGFKVEVQETETRLGSLKNHSQELQGSLDDIKFLVEDLKKMGVDLDGDEGKSYLDDARSFGKRLSSANRNVREAVKDLDSLKEKFEHSRDRLVSILDITPEELSASPEDLVKRIKEHLAAFAFEDKKLELRLQEVLELLSEITAAAGEIERLAELVQKNQDTVSKIRAQLLKRIRISLKKKGVAKERQLELREKHRQLYPKVHYLTSAQRQGIQKNAPMAAKLDSAMANAFAAKYISGFVRKKNKAKNRVEKINFTHLGKEVIRIEISLVHMEMGEDFKEKENRKVISLDVTPRVVKTEKDNFDFVIKSLSLAKEGRKPVELKTEFGLILDSTLSLLNQLVERLNDTPYAQLRFQYYPHLSILRIKNGIPVFQSFPNFKISDVALEEGVMRFYGGIPGKKLGEFLGKRVDSQEHPKPSAGVSSSAEPENWNDYERVEPAQEVPSGNVSIRIAQKLINNFYTGFRKGFLSTHHTGVQDTTLSGRVASFFRGLHEFGIGFFSKGRTTAYFRGDLTQISKETADFYNKAIKIIAPFQGFRKGLKEGASNVISFVTFGQVEIEVDPDDYKVPSGQFAISLSGESQFKNPSLEMNFNHLSLYDPVNHGALQPYIKLVKVAASVARLTGRVRDGLKHVANLIPGVEMEISGENLDEVIFSYIAKMLVSQINQNIDGIVITPRTYKSYGLVFDDFTLIPDVSTTIEDIVVKKNFLELKTRLH